MKSRGKIIILVLFFIALTSWTRICREAERRVKQDIMAQDIENALNDIDPGWKTQAVTTDTPVTYFDDQGNTIILHCLETKRYGSSPAEISGVDMDVFALVIDVTQADSARKSRVNGEEAILYQKGERSYLCWTFSDQYSFILEYTSDIVMVEEILQMAESLKLS